MRLTGTFHTGFTVASTERSLAFYRDLLGMEVVAQQVGEAEYLGRIVGMPGVRILVTFVAVPGDEHRLELLEYLSHPGEPTPRETNRPGNGHICFYVDDLAGLYQKLVDNAVQTMSPPVEITAGVNKGALALYARDPDGFSIELFQRRTSSA